MRVTMMIAAAALAAMPATAQPAGSSQPSAHDYSRRMAALTPLQRYGAVRNAIVQSNLWCKRVTGLAYQGPYKNLDMWVARCGPTPVADYGVFLGPDGTAQVSTCADLVRVKWPACRKLP